MKKKKRSNSVKVHRSISPPLKKLKKKTVWRKKRELNEVSPHGGEYYIVNEYK